MGHEIAVGPVDRILDDSVARFPDRPAIDFMGRVFLYSEFGELVAAKGLQALGVGPGVHVGLYLDNTPHYLISFFAVLKAGGVVVNYSPLDAEPVLAHKPPTADRSADHARLPPAVPADGAPAGEHAAEDAGGRHGGRNGRAA
ncbi:AMP-binding protein [Roseateles sp. GG27B]